MSSRRLRWLGLGLISTAGAGVMALAATMNSAFAYGDPTDPAGSTIGLVMGGSGLPLPNYNVPGYVGAADSLYIHPNFPDTTYPAPYADGLFTAEYPLLSMPMSINYPTATSGPLEGFPALISSMGQGMLTLENAITTNEAAGDTSTVFGYSQSSTISGLVMEQLDPAGTPSNLPIQFVLIGDPSAPNGGALERFDGLNLPSLGLVFDGATPADSFQTDIYTLEYDGFADFPRYPIDILSDLNALLGMVDIHGLYLNQAVTTPGPGPTAADIANATLLPGSEDSPTDPCADCLTNYYMIDEAPPLVTLLAGIPVIGKPLADLLGPDLTVLINLGFGPGDLGYSDTPANVPTQFGLFPDVSPVTVVEELVTGVQQGFSAVGGDLLHPSLSSLMPAASSLLPSLTDLSAALSTAAGDSAAVSPGIFNGITTAIAAMETLLLQTGDMLNAAVTSVPGYDLHLFFDNLAHPLDAIGLPIAADTGLLTEAAGLEFFLIQGATTVAIQALIP